MNGMIDRTVVAQVVIVMVVCMGTWFIFVEPRAVDAQQLEEEIRIGSEQASSIDQATIQQLATRLDEVRSRVRGIEERGEIARDSSQLYSIIMELARANRVTVGSLNPGNPQSARASGRSSQTADRRGDEFVISREMALSVSGRYEDIASFVDALQSLSGYIELQYLSVAEASGEPGIVNARLTCRTLRFTLPAKLREMLGSTFHADDDADQPEGGGDDA